MSGQVCTFCVMDTSALDIEFDAEGRCNYCREFAAELAAAPSPKERDRRRDAFIAEVKKAGRGKRYDCVVGVSGGVDSSYALYLAVKSGLRPLAVHLDNGWNSEISSHNIANLVTRLGVDLVTHVIEWGENRALQRAFFDAGVIDIELLMDNAMFAANFEAARRFGVHHILGGTNSATEGMRMPPGWNHFKWDARNIRSIFRAHGRGRIRTHPLYSVTDYILDRFVRRITWVSFLNFFDYDKKAAIAVLVRECGYKPYAHKHYESVFTRFYQGFILPRKFGVDKRRLHLSSLIVSGQETRDHALKVLEGDPYPDPELKREDMLFVRKKFGFSEKEFEDYLERPAVPHDRFATEWPMMDWMIRAQRRLRRMAGRT